MIPYLRVRDATGDASSRAISRNSVIGAEHVMPVQR